MMGWRTKLVSGDEYDALSRNHLVHHWQPGARKAIKRQHNKRVRHAENRRLNLRMLAHNTIGRMSGIQLAGQERPHVQ